MRRVTVALSAAAIAEHVGGRLEGDPSLAITAVGPLDGAHGGTLSFLSSKHYVAQFEASEAGCVLVTDALRLPQTGPGTRIWVADATQALARALGLAFPARPPVPRIAPTASIGRGCRLGAGVSLGHRCSLGAGSRIGDETRIGPGTAVEQGVSIGSGCEVGPLVTIYAGSRLGDRVRVKAGAVIGGPGFGYLSDADGHHEFPHVGGCVLEDDVSVGANSCVDRGSVGDTVVGKGTKLDNHVHIGHNARLGHRCLVMGGVVVAGSARVGNDVILAGHSAVGGHFRVGDRVRVAAKSGVIGEIPDGTDVGGFPARPHREFLRAQAALYRLVPLIDELETLVRSHRDHDPTNDS